MSDADRKAFLHWGRENLPCDRNDMPYCTDQTDPEEIWQAALDYARSNPVYPAADFIAPTDLDAIWKGIKSGK